jgi:hypothetical protein
MTTSSQSNPADELCGKMSGGVKAKVNMDDHKTAISRAAGHNCSLESGNKGNERVSFISPGEWFSPGVFFASVEIRRQANARMISAHIF